LELYLRQMASRNQQVPEQYMGVLRTQLLNQMISEELLHQESKTEGIVVKPEDVDHELTNIKARYKDPKEYESTLSNMKLTEEKLKHKLLVGMEVRQLLDKKIISGVTISDEEAKSFYDKNPKNFEQPEQIRARHILIAVDKDATAEQKAEARSKIKKLKERIVAGEDFATLAKENSSGPSSAQGGDLGYFSKGTMVKPFAEAAFALEINEVSDIVETSFGYHLIKLLDRRPASVIAFDEAKPKIIQELRNETIKTKINEYLTALRSKAKIETYIK
jgi:peptidyl-prolyl cis-trans isomerase C